MHIFDLPPDLLVVEIPRYLLPEETHCFATLNKRLYDTFYRSPLSNTLYHTYYNKKFTNNQHFELVGEDGNWKELFSERVSPKQRVFTWGCNDMGRLGYRMPGFAKVNTPTNVSNFNGHIVTDIVANGYSFFILTNSGQLYYTGDSWKRDFYACPAPYEQSDYRPPPQVFFDRDSYVAPRHPLRTRVGGISLPFRRRETTASPGARSRLPTSSNLRLPPERQPNRQNDYLVDSQGSENDQNQNSTVQNDQNDQNDHSVPSDHSDTYLTKLVSPGRIVSFSAGRQHVLALDTDGNIHTWDTGSRGLESVRLTFPGISLTYPTKICAGWDLSACYEPSVGLVVWYSREPLTKDTFEARVANAHYFVVPETAYCVDDMALGEGTVLFVKNGELYVMRDINPRRLAEQAAQNRPVPLDEVFMRIETVESFNSLLVGCKFSKVRCSFKSFVLFTNDDQVWFGSFDGMEPRAIPELQKRRVVDVQLGDYHSLALTREGELYAWGTESQFCGCLGLGGEVGERLGHGLRVVRPERVGGRWVRVTAGGWQSGGIGMTNERSEDPKQSTNRA